MAGSDGEMPDVVADAKSEREAKQPTDQQNWKPVIIHLGGGGGITGALYAASRLFGEPHDGWVIALGLVTAIITTAFVLHDLYPANGSAIRSVAGFAILLVLLGIAARTHFIWEKQKGPSAPETFHVTQGATISAEYAGITSPLVAMVSGLGNTIIAVHLIAFFTIENTQSVPATIESYSLEGSASPNGPWRNLCPISLVGASVYTFTAVPQYGGIQDVVPLDFSNNSLEKRLMARTIGPHETISGWGFWDCTPWCDQKVFRFNIRDTAGLEASVALSSPYRPGELQLQNSFFPIAKRDALHIDLTKPSFRIWNPCAPR